MSATLNLTRNYASFFTGCARFAFSPFTNTFFTIAGDEYGSTGGNILAASIVCGLLTFAVPVLPIATAFTSTLAAICLVLAAASMCITYPLAVLSDSLDTSWQERSRVEVYRY